MTEGHFNIDQAVLMSVRLRALQLIIEQKATSDPEQDQEKNKWVMLTSQNNKQKKNPLLLEFSVKPSKKDRTHKELLPSLCMA